MNEWMKEGRKEWRKRKKEGRKEGTCFFVFFFLHPVNYDGCIRAKTFLVNTYTLWCVELGLWGLGLCCSLGTEKTNQIAYLLSKNTESLLNVQMWACLFFSFFFFFFFFFLSFFFHTHSCFVVVTSFSSMIGVCVRKARLGKRSCVFVCMGVTVMMNA